MSVISGSLESVTLDGRNFPVTADADVIRKNGGYENEVQSNADGSARIKKTRVAWSLAGLVVQVDNARADHEFLQNLADGNENFPIVASYPDGSNWQGQGTIIDEMQVSSQSASAAVSLGGPGKLTQQ